MNLKLRIKAFRKAMGTGWPTSSILVAQAYIIFNLFVGILTLGNPPTPNHNATGWLFLVITWQVGGLWGGVSLGMQYAEYKKSKEFAEYREFAQVDADGSNAVFPIIGHMPPSDNDHVIGQDIYDTEHKTSVNVISLPSLMYKCKKDDEIIFRYMLVVEHEVLHGISQRYDLNIKPKEMDWLKEYFMIFTPQHWSYPYLNLDFSKGFPSRKERKRYLRYREILRSSSCGGSE